MHIRTAFFVGYMLISLPISIIYVIELVLLSIRPEFSSSFYILFMFTGIIDLISFTMNIFFYYLPFLPGASEFYSKFENEQCNNDWRPEYYWMLSIANTCMYYLPTVQDVINVLVSFNRMLALLMPLTFKNIFTRKFTLALIPFTLLFSFSSCFVTVAAPCYFIDISAEDEEKIYMLYGDSRAHFPSIERSTIASAHTFVCNGICFVVNCYIATKILLSRVCSKAASSVSNSNEFRLFLLGFLILLSNIPSIGYQIYWSICQRDGSSFVFMCLPWVIMIKTLSPALLMLLTNTRMRKEMRLLLSRLLRGSNTRVQSSARGITMSSAQGLVNQDR